MAALGDVRQKVLMPSSCWLLQRIALVFFLHITTGWLFSQLKRTTMHGINFQNRVRFVFLNSGRMDHKGKKDPHGEEWKKSVEKDVRMSKMGNWERNKRQREEKGRLERCRRVCVRETERGLVNAREWMWVCEWICLDVWVRLSARVVYSVSVCMSLCMHVCMCVFIFVCMCARVCVCLPVCVYVLIRLRRPDKTTWQVQNVFTVQTNLP